MLAITDHSHIAERKKKKIPLLYIQQLFVSPGQLERNQAGVTVMLLFFQN